MIRPLPTSPKTPKRADVVLVLFPNSDLRTAKMRPALIVQADGLNTGLPQLVVSDSRKCQCVRKIHDKSRV